MIAPVRAAPPGIAPPGSVTLIAAVGGVRTRYYEVYYHSNGAIRKAEISPSGTPR